MSTKLTQCPQGTLHARPEPDDILWVPYDGSTLRSKAATCQLCSHVIYEWGTIGGAHRIRRTNLQTGLIRVTPAVRRADAAAWWQALTGHTP